MVMNAHLNSSPQHSPLTPVVRAAELACKRIAPLFDIRDMIAVNPFLGFVGQDFFQSALLVESIFHEEMLPRKGAAAAPRGPRIWCVADRLREQRGELVAGAPLSSLSRLLAAYLDDSAPAQHPRASLFSDYLDFAVVDRSVDAAGLRGYRERMKQSPRKAHVTLTSISQQLTLSSDQLSLYFSRLFARLPGYAGFLRAQGFGPEGGSIDALLELLAILLLQDRALAELSHLPFLPRFDEGEPGYIEERLARYTAMQSGEANLAAALRARLKAPSKSSHHRPRAQLVFCIDVRSERYRRHLERNADIETYGFAGFFGIPMAVASKHGIRPHCPPLLRPNMTLHVEPPTSGPVSTLDVARSSFKRSLAAPLSSLCHVEAWGLTYLGRLLSDVLPKKNAPALPRVVSSSIEGASLIERVQLARGIVRNTGLTRPLAPLVVFVGHDSHVTNNPQAGGLACGACAGHSGAPSAQVAAALLNDLEVRAHLSDTPDAIDDGVLFVAAEHETVTDRVQLIRPPHAGVDHELLDELQADLDQATRAAQVERAQNTPGVHVGAAHEFNRRAHDPAETQPEWGLAGNALFLVGDRALSREVPLDGTAFLHSYDARTDPDGSILQMILTAPAVVGSWINLQYYASTVAPRTFGSGRKTLHNLSGNIGVVEGGQGDLAVGLSRESLFGSDGAPVHSPVRLHVVVQAPTAKVRAIVARNESVRQLVAGGWIVLSTLRVDEKEVHLERVMPEEVSRIESDPMAAE